jgi:hypothetical protein
VPTVIAKTWAGLHGDRSSGNFHPNWFYLVVAVVIIAGLAWAATGG